jgi:TRAP-type C4-dicarboxylate transport system substrate-binding protein
MMKRKYASIVIGICAAMVSICTIMTPTIAVAKVIKLTISDHNPPFTPPGKAMATWVKKVNEQAKGKMELTLHGGGALLSGTEAYRGVQSGVVDAAHYVVDTREGFILNLITGLPFLGWPDRWVAEDMYKELMRSNADMRAEWEGVTIVSLMMMPGMHIHMAKELVLTPTDLKGKKMMGAETILNAVMKASGATPIHMDIGDMAPSLNTGLIEGILTHLNVLKVFGGLEHVPHHTYFGGGITFTPMFLVMNTSKLNSLPPDMKQLILDSGYIWHDTFKELEVGFSAHCLAEAKKMNHTFKHLTPEEIAPWYNLVKGPVHDKWIQDAEAKGRPGQELYNKALDMIKNYKN